MKKQAKFSTIAVFTMLMTGSSLGLLSAQTNTFPATGNVGIGTTSPGKLLDIANNGSSSAGVQISNGTGKYFLAVGAVAANDGLFTVYDSVHLARRLVIDPSGNVGLGTAAPIAQLDLSGRTYKLSPSSATQEIPLFFPDGANNKIDIFFGFNGGGNGLWGCVDVELTETYHGENDNGIIHKRFYVGLSLNGTVLMNQSRIVDEGGSTADAFAISDVVWDATQSKFKITIVHRRSPHAGPLLRLTQFVAGAVQATDSVLSATAGSVYATDTTEYPRSYVNYNNRVGFGTTAPDQQIDVRGNIAMGRRAQSATTRYIGLQGTDGAFGTATGTTGMAVSQTAAGDSQLQFFTGQWGSADQARMTITKAGLVGIGTATPCAGSTSNCLLAVKGSVRANEVIVDTGWSDYVFDAGHKIAPLSEVEDYIVQNHHLPDIPSAKEVAESGVSVGEMQSKLLAKIEELTLHMIELEKRSTKLEKENTELLQQNRDISAKMSELQRGR